MTRATGCDHQTDLLIVGSGAAGLTAAVVAAGEGLDVLVLEKTRLYGGTTALSGGVAWIPNNPLMARDGIEDSPEDALTYLQYNVGNRVAQSKLRAFVEQAPKMVDYLLANSALRFNIVHGFPDYRPETPGGRGGGRSIDPKVFSLRRLHDGAALRRVARALPGGLVGSVTELRRLAFFRSNPLGLLKVWTVIPRNLWNRVAQRQHVSSGGALIARLRYTLQEKGVPLWLESSVEELVAEGDRVIGARVSRQGADLTVHARRGVLIAAGGFERNPEMRARYFGTLVTPEWASGTYTSGASGNTGDGIRAGQQIGAALDLMDDVWWMPSSMPPDSPPAIHVFERGLPHMMIVNARGERFANEARPYNELGRVIFEEEAQPVFMVFDHTYRSRYALGTMLPGVTPERYLDGYLKRAESIAELASVAGIDAGGLVQTVERFNAMAASGVDEEFHKGESAFDRYAGDPAHRPNPCLGPVSTPPFYAVALHAGDLGTKGGLLTNEHAQVLRPDGSVISGLYAAGNSSASVMGEYYPGAGGTIGPAMTYGYIAAMHAAGR